MSAEEGHSAPAEGKECMVCMDDIDMEKYVEYRVGAGGPWKPCGFCVTCVETLLATQWQKYVDQLAKASCKAEQRRLLDRGPPITIYDRNGLPCPEGQDVDMLWYGRDKQEYSAKLAGALEGQARRDWWDEKLQFKFEEADDDSAQQSKG
ncbi:hypothetical protein JKP88DRAFT_235159 [Tribonema minus]|uniref:Uncharacterized protein n=1 Tax=Tribonema minus TaxID=303371 RepID=A0A835Z5F2_9STRA|nr:hypothetical protein JKP88DRAFT_235159 [Tribonema minus]